MSDLYGGERVRAARHLLSVSQVDLANATGFSQSLVSQVENGSRPASSEFLDAVASATVTPRSFFNVLPPDLPNGTLRFRKYATSRATDTKRAEVLIAEAYRVATDLLNDVSYHPPQIPVSANELLNDDIEELSLETREALGASCDGPIRHLTRLCERGGIAVTPLTLPSEMEDSRESIGHFGASCWPSTAETALIGWFSSSSGDRQRFTLAHELGHLVLHSRRRAVRDPEAEANRFAGALLFPRARAVEAMAEESLTLTSYAHLKASWGLSIQAIIMRGGQLGLVDDKRRSSLFKQLTAKGWRKNEPVVVPLEEPLLLWKALVARYGQAPAYAKAADDLGLPVMILRGLIPPPSARRADAHTQQRPS